MDFISIKDGITGLVTAANQVISHFHKALILDSDTLSVLGLAVGHLKTFRESVSIVGNVLDSLEQKPNSRSSLIKLEAVRSILTDALLAFSDLQRGLGQVVENSFNAPRPTLNTGILPPSTDELLESIRLHQSSLALLVNVFNAYANI
jgi:hypothetical protein